MHLTQCLDPFNTLQQQTLSQKPMVQQTLASFVPNHQTQQQSALLKQLKPSQESSIYDQTLKFMMTSQKLREKELEDLKDREGVLLCYRCQRPVNVVDKENDKYSKMTKEEQDKLREDQKQVGKVSNDIVEVYVKQKCSGC